MSHFFHVCCMRSVTATDINEVSPQHLFLDHRLIERVSPANATFPFTPTPLHIDAETLLRKLLHPR